MILTSTSLMDLISDESRLELFCSEYLFECVPYIFSGDSTGYFRWKATLADRLGVDPRDLILIGSAAVGFSLDPDKNLREFDDASDVDVAVLSQRHFDIAWRHLRGLGARGYRMLPDEQQAVKSHRRSYIYWGVIATDMILGHLPFGPEWTKALSDMAEIDPTKGRIINARLYHDSEALRSYHVNGLKRLREQILTEPE